MRWLYSLSCLAFFKRAMSLLLYNCTSVAQSGAARTIVVDVEVASYSHPRARCLQPLNVLRCSQTNKRTLRSGFCEGLRRLVTYLRRCKTVAGRRASGCRITKKMKCKSAFKPFINAYNHRMCTLNMFGSTGNKQTNKRTLAFYKGIDGTLFTKPLCPVVYTTIRY